MTALLALPSDLPRAKLPAAYEGAKVALAECTRLDECQNWADKAEALAAYAKQAQDEQLRKMADRIQARAIRRCGELLQQIQAASGRRTDLEPSPGAPTRSEAAREAGLTRHQHHTAIRVARVPDPEFEEAVEGDDPATVTELAERGTVARDDHLNGCDPDDFRAATAMLGLLHHINRNSEGIDIEAAVRGLSPRETDDAAESLNRAQNWIDEVFMIFSGLKLPRGPRPQST
jgi:hypothetical protein